MKLDLKKIINIKNQNDIKYYKLDKPLFHNNYLFHYLILLRNLDGLKLTTYPIYIENNDGMNGFHLAAKEYEFDIVSYLISKYPDYIYNKDKNNNSFVYYMPFNEISHLIRKFPKLNWIDLIEFGSSKQHTITKMILSNLNYTELKQFLLVYKLDILSTDQLLVFIMQNHKINNKDKIKILDDFTTEELNLRTKTNEGLLSSIMDNSDLFKYMILRDVELNYYSYSQSYPIFQALYLDIMRGTKIKDSLAIIIYNKIKTDKNFYTQTDKFLDNIAHKIIFFRYTSKNNTNNDLDLIILKECNDEIWNQVNINNYSPFELIVKLDYKTYSKLFTNIKINKDVMKRVKKDNINKEWIELFSSLKEYNEPNNIVTINNLKYSHATLFQSRFTDLAIFCIYLTDKYKNLYLPNMESYLLNNIVFDETTGYPFADDLIMREPIFPWIINYNTNSTYYIHPYLNTLINTQLNLQKSKHKRFGCVFLSIITDSYLHANILIYDFENKTVERFEPYGNITQINNIYGEKSIDAILEEELTWNTGLRYIKPNEYLPYASFQMISDENNVEYQKAGDFGGFCLAWSIWYLENRLMNPDVSQSVLVKKLIGKISNSDIKFIEYIRNYANKINESRIKYLTNIGIHLHNTSDLHLHHKDDMMLIDYLVNKYKL